MKTQGFAGRGRKLLTALVAVLACAAVAWVERTSLLAWYYVHNLAAAEEADRAVWVDRTAGLDVGALPRLLECLRRDDARACANVQTTLTRMMESWGPRDERRAALAVRLADEFPRLSVRGQQSALAVAGALIPPPSGDEPPAEVRQATARLLRTASSIAHAEVRRRTLTLAAALAESGADEGLLPVYRELAAGGLRHADADMRARAVPLAVRPGVDLQKDVVPLLGDPTPEVRRMAMLAVGAVPEVIATDALIRWLHDPDSEVRQSCEAALRQRGVQGTELILARLISAEQADARLQVVLTLPDTNVEPGVWLRRLSLDPAPAVRAAALRMAAEPATEVDLSDRMEQMAQNDPSPTVRQLAQYYLSCRKPRPTGNRLYPAVGN